MFDLMGFWYNYQFDQSDIRCFNMGLLCQYRLLQFLHGLRSFAFERFVQVRFIQKTSSIKNYDKSFKGSVYFVIYCYTFCSGSVLGCALTTLAATTPVTLVVNISIHDENNVSLLKFVFSGVISVELYSSVLAVHYC